MNMHFKIETYVTKFLVNSNIIWQLEFTSNIFYTAVTEIQNKMLRLVLLETVRVFKCNNTQ